MYIIYYIYNLDENDYNLFADHTNVKTISKYYTSEVREAIELS